MATRQSTRLLAQPGEQVSFLCRADFTSPLFYQDTNFSQGISSDSQLPLSSN
ncbi:hypothetical protein [Nostoc sp. LPT]|uniref:hypothetical protein n=1 Tax=Nostoc sp. LPT TaxID=2815387 RepID=UPI001DB2BF52|nr:hypothetical protein [Nostoc sp. LPT]MBN4002317.1 hypothetical protein [Nostoc sp. LPT]